jgi:hypothetical protein
MALGEQRLPLPVGSPHAVRRPRRVFRGARPLERILLTVLGMSAALAGVVLTLLPPTVTVGLDSHGYSVGDVLLEPRGQGIYTSPEAALVLFEDAGAVRAGASTHVGGERMLGGCRVSPRGRSERCWFQLGGHSHSAVDTLRDGGWERRYEDGRQVRIHLKGGRPVPVPFPIGR